MRHLSLFAALLAVAAPCACYGQASKSSKASSFASGVLAGRSGKPLAGARVFLGRVEDDSDVLMAKVRLSGLPVTQTDAQGKFKLSGFVPGNYTILYYPAGGLSYAPNEISIRSLQAVDHSILPLMKDVEIGTTTPLDDRKWASFMLLKGHTFWAQGANMKIWNATLRKLPSGPYLEVRKGLIWQTEVKDGGQINVAAWSY